MALTCGAVGLSAVCDCGISLSYSLTIFVCRLDMYLKHTKSRTRSENVEFIFSHSFCLLRM